MSKNKFMAGRIALRLAAVVLALSILAAVTVHSGKTEKRNAFNNPEFLSMLTAAYGAESVALDPHIRDFKLPEQIPWKKREAGGETALVYGDPAKPDKCFQDVRPQCDGEGNHIAGNTKYMGFAQAGGGGKLVFLFRAEIA